MEVLLTLICLTIICIYFYFHNAFCYWKRKGVPYIEPSFPLGNINLSFAKYGTECIKDIYNQLKSRGVQYGGMYILSVPIFLPIHPDIIKSLLMKNFEYFHDRGVYNNEESDPLSANLFAIEGQKWKVMRGKINPTLTSSKLKNMFPTMVACSDNIDKVLIEYAGSDKSLDLTALTGNYNTDIIGSCVFGLECNSLIDPKHEFRKYGRLFFHNRLIDKFKLLLGILTPFVLRFFQIGMINSEVTNYFMTVVKETIQYREKHKVYRNDLMDIIIKIKNNEQIDDNMFSTDTVKSSVKGTVFGFTANEIAAVAFTFYVAGFETSATLMDFCMFELSENIDIQRKLREEIHVVLRKNHDQISYDAIMEMQYLDQVVNETLRKHPPLYMLNRICTKDFNIVDTDITIVKGTRVIIPVLGLHFDPQYFPNPEVFNPDRFSDKETSKQIPCTYLPFGEGPRHCIGQRMGLLQTKLGIVSLLKNHKYTIHPQTKYPIKQASNTIILSTDKSIYLKVEYDPYMSTFK